MNAVIIYPCGKNGDGGFSWYEAEDFIGIDHIADVIRPNEALVCFDKHDLFRQVPDCIWWQ